MEWTKAKLKIIKAVNNSPGLYKSQIMRVCNLTYAFVVGIIKELEKGGYVKTFEGTADKRRRHVFATKDIGSKENVLKEVWENV